MPVAKKTGNAARPYSMLPSLNQCSDDEEDETAELLRELEKIKKERAEKQAQEVLDLSIVVLWRTPNQGHRTGKKPRRNKKIANETLLLATLFLTRKIPLRANEGPLQHVLHLATADDPHRWDDDVVFRNQARGTENKGKREFVNVRH